VKVSELTNFQIKIKYNCVLKKKLYFITRGRIVGSKLLRGHDTCSCFWNYALCKLIIRAVLIRPSSKALVIFTSSLQKIHKVSSQWEGCPLVRPKVLNGDFS